MLQQSATDASRAEAACGGGAPSWSSAAGFLVERPPGTRRPALAASGGPGMRPEDRTHLARVVAGRTGISGGDAEKRVDDFIGASSSAIKKARRSAILVAFMTAAGLLLGAAVAWIGAAMGGIHRDGTPFSLTWSLRPTARNRAESI